MTRPRVYRLDWFCRINGNRIEWFARMRDAKARQDQLIIEPGTAVGEVRLQIVEIPTTQATIVRWLNQNFRSGNV